ncbi:MAG: F0F1 ATP synthase subunit A [Cellulosilyticum sp.]|nr:F0F1 ATP synthase subunit A [Cellulosilyticum sp.]
MEQSLDFGAALQFKLFEVGGQTIYLTETVINTWVIIAAMTIIALAIRFSMKKFKDVPESKFQTAVEMVVDILNNFVANTMGGSSGKKFAGYFGPLIIFVAVCNLSGLLGFRPPTADFATTLAFALITFFMIHGFGIKSKGLGYFKGFLEPIPFLLPINIVGELATPVSLSFRLFGNILGGTIIMGLVYAMFPKIVIFLGIPAALHTYFDVFAGVLQAFIFVMLSMTFVSNAMDE